MEYRVENSHGTLNDQNPGSSERKNPNQVGPLKRKHAAIDGKSSNDKEESIVRRLNPRKLSEKDLAKTIPSFGDISSDVRAKRIRKRRKKDNLEGTSRPSVDDDVEDNLEANAARMLSSRFDLACTGFSSDAASDDGDEHRRKAPSRKRRHFYEVLAKDFDARWMVQKEIQVYWPLDQVWYFGRVMGYDSETLCHHIKYDIDCGEEWIDLQHQRIKLLLYPSELPSGRRASRGRRRVTERPAAVVGGTPHAEVKGKSPAVYVRRRFRQKKNGDQGCDDGVVVLALSVPALNTGICSSGVEILWLSHATLMLQHGTLTTLWPRVHLGMVLVDNISGLRFLLFEGGLVQGIALVFSVLDAFYQSGSHRDHVDGQVPVTSVRFEFAVSGNVKKRLAFALWDFHGLESSRWASLDRMFQKIGSLVKLLPTSECTCDNIKALEECHDQSQVLQGRSKRAMMGSSASVIQHQSWVDRDASSSSTATTLFASLHLNLLTGCSISHNIKETDCCPEMVENGASAGGGDAEMLSQPSPPRVRIRRATKRLLESMETEPSPDRSGPKKPIRSRKTVKPDLLRTAPRKPRTPVSYSLPLEVDEATTKSRAYQTKGFSYKRIRRTCRKEEPDTDRSVELETLSCDVNVLVIMGVKGWREKGARVVLELVDGSEWRLTVKISESTRYSFKASRFLLSGSTNRFTQAMMWRGGKEWILEFHGRSDWALFKEMHEECYSRNLRAASVKNIPIPGVRLIEENDDDDDDGVEVPFVRSSPEYYQHSQTDVEIAMDPRHVMYDMDSDDEVWISELRTSGVEDRVSRRITDELFERIMDTLEKFSYTNQQDQLTPADLEELAVVDDGGSVEAIRVVYEHWVEKRKKKGMPLIRHLQPPLWEVYQKKLQEWESMPCNNGKASKKRRGKARKPEKPPLFAFCLKPRGLEPLKHRGTKQQRSHKKLQGHSGRRSNGSTSGGGKMLHRRGSSSQNPRDHQNKSKKNDTSVPRKGVEPKCAPDQRLTGRRSGMQGQGSAPADWRKCKFGDLDPDMLDDQALYDAIKAARDAVRAAEVKREKAEKLLFKADLAKQKAASAVMLADAIKAASASSCKDASCSDDSSI